jgi:hypothetical protein
MRATSDHGKTKSVFIRALLQILDSKSRSSAVQVFEWTCGRRDSVPRRLAWAASALGLPLGGSQAGDSLAQDFTAPVDTVDTAERPDPWAASAGCGRAPESGSSRTAGKTVLGTAQLSGGKAKFIKRTMTALQRLTQNAMNTTRLTNGYHI